MINRTENADYDYELQGDTLIIRVQIGIWTSDLLPLWLREIFSELRLEDANRVRYIHVEGA